MRRKNGLWLSFGALALLLFAAALGSRMFFEHRAEAFHARCDAAAGATRHEASQQFDDVPVMHRAPDQDGELTVSYHYGIAGSESCTLGLHEGRVSRVSVTRRNDFDSCADPVSYPRRHWFCQIARVLVP